MSDGSALMHQYDVESLSSSPGHCFSTMQSHVRREAACVGTSPPLAQQEQPGSTLGLRCADLGLGETPDLLGAAPHQPLPRDSGHQCRHPYSITSGPSWLIQNLLDTPQHCGLSHPLTWLRPNTSMSRGHRCRAEGISSMARPCPAPLGVTADGLDLAQQYLCPLAAARPPAGLPL